MVFKTIISNFEYQIFDFTGKTTMQGKSTGKQIAVQNLDSNFYFIRYQFKDRIAINKFYKE